MFNHSSSSDFEPRNEEFIYQTNIQNLAGEVEALENEVQEKKTSLAYEYDKSALQELSKYFQNIHSRYIRYTKQIWQAYFKAIHRSENRKQAANGIVNLSRDVAKLFEKYARNPKTYSKVDSESKIDLLLAEISNLRHYCNQ